MPSIIKNCFPESVTETDKQRKRIKIPDQKQYSIFKQFAFQSAL